MTQEQRFVQKADEELRMVNIAKRNADALRSLNKQLTTQRYVQAQRAIAQFSMN